MKNLILIGFFILELNLYSTGIDLGIGGGYGKYLDDNTGSFNLSLEIDHEIFPDIELGFGGLGEFNFKNKKIQSFPVYLTGKFYSKSILGLYIVGRYGRTFYKDTNKIGAYSYLGIGKILNSKLSIEGGISVANQDTKESTLDHGNIELSLIKPIF